MARDPPASLLALILLVLLVLLPLASATLTIESVEPFPPPLFFFFNLLKICRLLTPYPTIISSLPSPPPPLSSPLSPNSPPPSQSGNAWRSPNTSPPPCALDVSLVNVDFWYFKGSYNASDLPFVKASYRSDTTCRLQTDIPFTKCKGTTLPPLLFWLRCK